MGIHYNRGSELLEYLKKPEIYQYKDGFIDVIQAPGLGVDVNEAYVQAQARIGHNWKNPVWRNFDGTIAEW